MNHFNYFSSYSESRRAKQFYNTKTLVIGAVTFTVLCAVVYGIFSFRVINRQRQLDFLNEIKQNEGFNQQFSDANKISEYIRSVDQELLFLEKLEEYADRANTANDALLDLIQNSLNGAIPARIAVSGNAITIDGYVDSVEQLITMEKSFRQTQMFQNVLVDTVSAKDGETDLLKFTCQLTLNGGAVQNEEKE